MAEKMTRDEVRILCLFAVAICCLALGFPISMIGAPGLVVGAVLLSVLTIFLREIGRLEGVSKTVPVWSLWFLLSPQYGLGMVIVAWLWGWAWRDWTWMSGVMAFVMYYIFQRATQYGFGRAEQQIPPPSAQTATTTAKQ